MKSKLLFTMIIVALLALIGTGCGLIGGAGGQAQPQSDEQVDRVPPAAAEQPAETPAEAPAAEAPTEAPAPADQPARVPPPITQQTAVAIPPSPVTQVATITNVQPCQLPVRLVDAPFIYERLGIPRHPGFTPSTGTVEIAVLFADYGNARATTSPDQELAALDAAAMSQYFSEVSYGQMEVVIKPYTTWINLPESSGHYSGLIGDGSDEAERTVLQEVVALADPNVDFSTTDVVFVIANPQATDGIGGPWLVSADDDAQGIQADGVAIRSGLIVGTSLLDPAVEENLRNNVFSRFLGLTMTLMRHGYRDRDIYPNLTDDERNAATGSFSIMAAATDAAHAPGMFAFERWQLGWLNDTQIFCQTGGEETTDLAAIEQADGTKAVMVPLGERAALVVESRRASGVDQELVKEGALVYTVNTAVEPSGAPIRVWPALDNDLYRDRSPLAQGESLTYCNITITNVTARDNGDSVRVTIPDVIECPQDVVAQLSVPAQQPSTPTQKTAVLGKIAACDIAAVPQPVNADVMVRFVNQSSFEGVVLWEDTTQSPVAYPEYFRMKDGEQADQETYAGDKWIVQEPGGATLLEYTASNEKTQCVLIKRPLGTLWLDFINQSGVPAYGYFVKADGSEEGYFQVGVGATTGLWSADNNVWRVRDGSGNVLVEYRVTSAANQQVIIPPLAATPTPTSAPAVAPTNTPAAAAPTNTPAPLPTNTVAPLPTNTPLPVPTDTPVPLPTDTPVPVPTDTPVPTTAPDPCANVPAPTGADVMVRFVNNSGTGVTVYWEDRNSGALVPYFTLNAGAFGDQETFAGDKWIVQDGGGGTRLTYTASAARTQCAIIP
ncbi:MAG: hypothetical protein H6668_18475 [Ardenticatenaceae bacterium]|nr:hypothetical protein [Ardenticatenaceae bacterium]